MESDLREEMARIGRLLYDRRLAFATGGNISVRMGDVMLITPSGVCKGMMSPEDMVIVSLATGAAVGNGKPSIETRFHLRFYREREDVGAVVHCHPPSCTALAVRGELMRSALTPEGIMLLGDVPMVPYSTPGGEGLAKAFSGLTSNNAFLMERHGALTVGKDLLEAFLRMEELEFVASLQLDAEGADELPPDEVERIKKL
jgi:L-fuculose-phosphate aldolase